MRATRQGDGSVVAAGDSLAHGGTRTDLLNLVVLLYLPIVLIAAWIVTNLLTPAVLLNLIVLLYLTIVLILGLVVTRKP